jgi:hypothetical protein
MTSQLETSMKFPGISQRRLPRLITGGLVGRSPKYKAHTWHSCSRKKELDEPTAFPFHQRAVDQLIIARPNIARTTIIPYAPKKI